MPLWQCIVSVNNLNPVTDTIQESLETHQLWIDEETPSKLVIKQRLKQLPCAAFLVFWSILFAGIPLGLVVLVSSQIGVSTLSCQRYELSGFNCDYSTRKLLGLGAETKRQSIAQVVDVKLDSAQWSNDNGGGTRKMWVTLMNQSGHLRLFETAYAYSVESDVSPSFQPEAAAEIKRLLNSDVSEFVIVEDHRWDAQFLGVLFLAIPFGLLSMGVAYGGLRSRTLILDKPTRSYTRKVHTLLGTQVKQHALDEIQAITTQERRYHRNGRHRRWYVLELSLKSNKTHRLPAMRRREVVSKIVAQMLAFMN